jgi:hypothetical protein
MELVMVLPVATTNLDIVNVVTALLDILALDTLRVLISTNAPQLTEVAILVRPVTTKSARSIAHLAHLDFLALVSPAVLILMNAQ